VVVTGMGVVSCLGNSLDEVSKSLHECKSGITKNEKYMEIGMKSHVCGRPDIDPSEFIDRKQARFMGDNCKYAYIAMQQAVADSGLSDEQIQSPRTAGILGQGGTSIIDIAETIDAVLEKKNRRIGPCAPPRSLAALLPPNKLAMYDVALPTAPRSPPAPDAAAPCDGRPSNHVGNGASIWACCVPVSAKKVKHASSATTTDASFSHATPTTFLLGAAESAAADDATCSALPRPPVRSSEAEPRQTTSLTRDQISTRSDVITQRRLPPGFDETRRTRVRPTVACVTRGSPNGSPHIVVDVYAGKRVTPWPAS
jgi:hypothetical protein